MMVTTRVYVYDLDHRIVGESGQFANAKLLAGAQHYYNRYRDYNPDTGRYIQADPIGLAGDENPYAYAMGNNLRYSDPTGEFVPLLVGLVIKGAVLGAGSDLALQAAMNVWGGRRPFDCINWTQVGVAGAIGGITGGIGGAGFQTAAGLSTKFSNVSKRIRRAEGLVGSGKDLHHWLLPRHWEKAFGGAAARIVNGRWNLNPLLVDAHRALHLNPSLVGRLWAGSPTWAKWSAGIGVGSIGGGVAADLSGLNKDCGCGR